MCVAVVVGVENCKKARPRRFCSWRKKEDFLDTTKELLASYTADVKIGYTEEEFRTWDQQRVEAHLYIADNLADIPLLDAIASSRGIPVADLVNNVIANADIYSPLMGHILGRKQGLVDLIDSAPDGAELDRILADELYVNWTV